MSTIIPVDAWGCFSEVADVIGTENAFRELGRVRNSGGSISEDSDDVSGAFAWSQSPQGFKFWNDIDEGNVPEGLEEAKPTLKVGDEIILSDTLKHTANLADFAGLRVRVIGLCEDMDGDTVMTVNHEHGEGFRAILATKDSYTFVDKAEEGLREKILEDWRAHTVENRLDNLDDFTTIRKMVDFVVENYAKSEPKVGVELVSDEDLQLGDTLQFVGYVYNDGALHGYQYKNGQHYSVGYDKDGDFGVIDEDGDASTSMSFYKFIRVA